LSYSYEYTIELFHESLNQNHKSILTNILSSNYRKSLSTNIQKEIEKEYIKYQTENEEKYINELNSYLEKEYSNIKSNVESNYYSNISDYIKDLTSFQNKINLRVNDGPNNSLHIKKLSNDILKDYNMKIDIPIEEQDDENCSPLQIKTKNKIKIPFSQRGENEKTNN